MLSTVRQKLNRLVHLISTHRALAVTAIIFAVLFFSFAGHIGWVHAAPDPAGTVAPSGTASLDGTLTGYIVEAITRSLLATARFFLSVTIFILTFIIEVSGYNGYLDANAVNVGWVMVRDFTNMLFIVALLVIAIGTILGLEHYEWKHMLVELVIAAVLVNFSRTICGLIIDAAQVVMNTFVNGIAATAAGNLVNAFGLNGIFKISPDVPSQNMTNMNVFTAGLGAVFFSAMVMCILGMFLVMLVIRMVTLWVLIVLSPIGFVLRILPQTEEYAKEWWGEFSKNVITGPILLFFIWLSFVTVGNGRINEDINAHSSTPQDTTSVSGAGAQSAGIGEFMKWNDMANFIIACAMLIVGAEVAQKLGGKGAGLIEQGLHAGQKLGAFASGVSTARWAANGVAQGAAAGGKFVAMNFPIVGGNYWKALGQNIGGRIGGKYYQLQQKRQQKSKDLGEYAKKYDDRKLELEQKLQKGGLTDEERIKTEKDLADHKASFSTAKYVGSRAAELAIMPPSRALKMGEDAMDIMEFEKTKLEKDASTSSTATGRWKAKARVEAEIIEERGKEKGQRRSDNIRAAMFGEAKNTFADPLAPLVHTSEEIKKNIKNVDVDLDKAKVSGDAKKIADLEARREKLVQEQAQNDKLLKPMQKAASGSLAYTFIKAKGQAHESHLKADESEHKLEEQFGHGEGHEMHVRSLKAEMGRDTAKNNIEEHDLQMKLQLMIGGLGKTLLEAQAGLDAQSNALLTAKQNILSNIREQRASSAKELTEQQANVAKAKALKNTLGVTGEAFEKAGEEAKKLASKYNEAERKLIALRNQKTEAEKSGKSKEEIAKIDVNISDAQKKVSGLGSTLARQRRLADGDAEAWMDVQKIPKGNDRDAKKTQFDGNLIKARNAGLTKMAGSNAEVASAYYQSLQDQSGILQNRSIQALSENMSQWMVGDVQNIQMPSNAELAAVEKVRSTYFKGMGKAELLAAAKARFTSIANKRNAAKAGNATYEPREQREDELFTQAIMSELHKEKYFDDQTGNTESSLELNEIRKMAGDVGLQDLDRVAERLGKVLAKNQTSHGSAGGKINIDQIKNIMQSRGDAFGDKFKQLLRQLPNIADKLTNYYSTDKNEQAKVIAQINNWMRDNSGSAKAGGFTQDDVAKVMAHFDALSTAYNTGGSTFKNEIEATLGIKH